MRQASSRGQGEPFYAMEVMSAANALAAAGRDVITLSVGQPSTPAPRPVLAAAHAALDGEVLGYTEAVGRLDLRERIARHYGETYDLDLNADDVLITTGSSGAFILAAIAAMENGETIAMTSPGYPGLRNGFLALGCRVEEFEVGLDTRFQPTVEMLDALPAVPRALVIASPANPTGTMIEPHVFAGLAAWCTEHDCLLMSDEIYHGITFGELPAVCAWQHGRDSLVFGSFSKYFSMTGWRLGWTISPPWLRDAMSALQGNLAICAPAVSQAAGVAAFDPESQAELNGHVARYRANRDLVLARLPEIGVTSTAPPDGAFYVYADVAHLTDDSLAWCGQVLQDTGVALAPGIDFDTQEGHHFVRISLAGDSGALNEAFDRLVAYLG